MSHFVFSISVKNGKWNLDTPISIFHIFLNQDQVTVLLIFLNYSI